MFYSSNVISFWSTLYKEPGYLKSIRDIRIYPSISHLYTIHYFCKIVVENQVTVYWFLAFGILILIEEKQNYSKDQDLPL